MYYKPWKALKDAFISSHSFFALCSVYYCCIRNYSKLQGSEQSFCFAYAFVSQKIQEGCGQSPLTWSLSCSCVQMLTRLQPSKGSKGLVVQDGALTWLKVYAGHQLGTHYAVDGNTTL